MKCSGRDALLRVRDGKPNTDAGHRVPIGSRFTASFAKRIFKVQ